METVLYCICCSKWCEVTYAWLEALRQRQGEALGIHVVPGVDVSAVGAPEVVRGEEEDRKSLLRGG